MSQTLRILAALSRVRTCPDCPACAALAAEILEGPDAPSVEGCPLCGFPKFRGEPCPCERYVGQPSNPASVVFKEASL